MPEIFGTWPLRGPRQTTWNPSTLFEARRPWGDDVPQTRLHAGLDLQAAYKDDVLAPEECTLVDVDRGWDGSARATLVHTASGRSLLLGCTEEAPPPGTIVPAGSVLARIGRYTRTVKGQPVYSSMLHLQVYDERITAGQANKWQSWALGADRPPHLIDPMTYLDLLDAPPAAPWDGPTPEVPCPLVDGVQVCQTAHVAWWEDRVRRHLRGSMDRFLAAGWDRVEPAARPEPVREGVRLYNHAGDVVDAGARSADPAARVRELVTADAEARRSGELFAGGSGGESGGGGLAAALAGVLLAGGAMALSGLGRRR